MQTKVLRAANRGGMRNDWLTTHHSFSFADYYNPEYMGFGKLRVLNEDFIGPRSGFKPHGHRDMEIITYVISGRLHHRDSMGNDFYISAGEIQQMSAGTGVTHSETNDDDDPVHLYQIWILPKTKGTTPGYGMLNYRAHAKDGLTLLVSGDGGGGSLKIGQDAFVYRGLLRKGEQLAFDLQPGRHLWVQNVKGDLDAAGESLTTADALAVTAGARRETVPLIAASDVEVLLFDS